MGKKSIFKRIPPIAPIRLPPPSPAIKNIISKVENVVKRAENAVQGPAAFAATFAPLTNVLRNVVNAVGKRIENVIDNTPLLRDLEERKAREEEKLRKEEEEIMRKIENEKRELQERQRIAAELAEELALKLQITNLKDKLTNYQNIEHNYNETLALYNNKNRQFNDLKQDYEKELTSNDNLKAAINTANSFTTTAIEERRNISDMAVANYVNGIQRPMDVYDEVIKQNQLLDERIQYLKDSFITNDQNAFYENQQTQFLSKVSYALFAFYYLLLIGLIYIMFIYNRNDNISKIFKIIIILSFGIYPFAITPIENLIYEGFLFILKFINGDPYIKK